MKLYSSQADDKAIVKLGVVAAKMQTAMVMHLEYRVSLPSHDFIECFKHHVISSLYAFMSIKKTGFGNSSDYLVKDRLSF